ncbi:MAG TPA: hypothetical protein VER12_13005 [Polyangiaceae bacterium]|nr:hypothetical protein [Polyangiaceae bacterium]
MRTSGRGDRLGGILIGLLGAFLTIAACGSPKRDFSSGAQAGRAGADNAGQGGVSGAMHGSAGSSAGKAAGSGAEAGGDGGVGGADQREEGGSAGVGGVVAPPLTDCLMSATRSCAEAGLLGSCAAGTQLCGPDGKWGACSVTAKPKDACATGNDDTCNGVANEGCACVLGAERACDGAKGNCANGKQTCADGTWSACSIAAKTADACTPGDDANCNGTPNEGCACKDGAVQGCGPMAVGICKPGTSTCSAGVWGACVGAVVAATRDCSSSLDNDCNGVADNTLDSVCQCKPAQQQACNAHSGFDGKGICKAGTQTCAASSNKSSSSWLTCSGDVGPAARNCGSSADNDCNGVADNTKDSVCQCDPTSSSSCASGSKCKSSGSASQCVTCLANSECNNGTCSANKCACTTGYSGDHCEFLLFQGIGVASGDSQGFINNVSHDGTTVVGYSRGTDSSSVQHALRWLNGTLTSIPVSASLAGSSGCAAMAVDANGVVVGYCETSSFQYANGTATLVSLSPNGGIRDVSKDGKVSIGINRDANGREQAFRRVNGVVNLLDKLDSDWSGAYGTSGDGSVVVGEEYIFFHTAWFWTAANGTKQLPQQAGGSGFGNYFATDVSTDGKVIVGYADEGLAVRWSGTSYANYQVTQNAAYAATNQDGSASVGTITTSSSTTAAAIWDANGVHQLTDYLSAANLNGWTLINATGISDDGKVVVGNGLHNGQNQGYIVHLP